MNKPNSTEEQTNCVVQILTDKLSTVLRGIYLYGSAVQGGLKENSDLDFLVVISEKLSKVKKKCLITNLTPLSRKMGQDSHLRYVEITIIVDKQVQPWSYPPKQDFIYGEWLQEKYREGYIPENEINPDLTILLYQARNFSEILYGQTSLSELMPEIPFKDVKRALKDSVRELVKQYNGDETNILLTLCRMITTSSSEKIYPKDVAGKFLLKDLPLQHKQFVHLAIKDYKGEENVQWEKLDISETISFLYKKLLKNI